MIFGPGKHVSDGLRTVGIAEGFPSDTPLAEVWAGSKLKHSIELENQIMFAQTLVKSLSACFNGGTFDEIVEHLIWKGDIEKARESREETRRLNESREVLDRFRAIARKWDDAGNRSDDRD